MTPAKISGILYGTLSGLENLGVDTRDLHSAIGRVTALVTRSHRFSPGQAVRDNELGAFLRELVRAPEISDAAFNWDETRGVGIGAHFLSSPHTLEHCRSQFRSAVFPRMGRDDYEKADRAGAFEAARDRALALIAADPPPGLPDPDAVAAIRAVAAAADADIIPKSRKVSGRREVI